MVIVLATSGVISMRQYYNVDQWAHRTTDDDCDWKSVRSEDSGVHHCGSKRGHHRSSSGGSGGAGGGGLDTTDTVSEVSDCSELTLATDTTEDSSFADFDGHLMYPCDYGDFGPGCCGSGCEDHGGHEDLSFSFDEIFEAPTENEKKLMNDLEALRLGLHNTATVRADACNQQDTDAAAHAAADVTPTDAHHHHHHHDDALAQNDSGISVRGPKSSTPETISSSSSSSISNNVKRARGGGSSENSLSNSSNSSSCTPDLSFSFDGFGQSPSLWESRYAQYGADDAEFDDVDDDEKPEFRRSSSLKCEKSPPDTPRRKKMVRFADALGLDLESVRHFLHSDQPPTVPASAFKPLAEGLAEQTSGNRYLSVTFAQPGADMSFLQRVYAQKVSLEGATVMSDMTILGTIRVMNMNFRKSVHVRYTLDAWKTHYDIPASYIYDTLNDNTDRFSFTLVAPKALTVGSRVEFAVRYVTGGQEYWDNNSTQNYLCECFARTFAMSESDHSWMHFL